MEKITIALVGQGPDAPPLGYKIISYASYALKAYLYANLEQSHKDAIEVAVNDFGGNATSLEMVSSILANKPDVVGFTVFLWNQDIVMECVQKIKSAKNDITIILGGPQVSPLAERVLMENPGVDIVPVSSTPGEIVLTDIVNAMVENKDFNTVSGICYRRSDGEIVRTSENCGVLKYENVPSPYATDDTIFRPDLEYMAVIETSRGCPYKCSYCFWSAGKRKIQYFPLERVLKDIEIVYNHPSVKQVAFADSNLFSDSKRAEIILKHIMKQKGKAKTYYESDCISLKQELAKLVAKLADSHFFLSIQTANPAALQLIDKKRASPAMFMKTVNELKQWIHEPKIKIDVMLGLPGDTFDGYMQTLDFVLRLEPFYVCLNYPIYLLPGSRFFENRKSLGLKHTATSPFIVIETPTFPKQQIEKALRISIWVQILTYYYPVIASFFYRVSRTDDARMKRLFCWIEKIEEKIDIFSICGNLSEIAINSSLDEWNMAKKAILRKASEIKSSYAIYSAIGNIEKTIMDSDEEKTILLGESVFEHMLQNKGEKVKDETYQKLSRKQFDDSKQLFSIYVE